MRNNKGRGSGLALLLILIVALLVAWLMVKQMGSLGMGGTTDPTQEVYVEDAQDAVDSLNDKMQQDLDSIEVD